MREQIVDNAINFMELEFYRVKRYKVPMSIAIIESNCNDLFNSVLKTTIRLTDLYQYLDSNHFLIIFDHTGLEGAKIALEKIVKNMEDVCDEELYVGVTEVLKADNDSSQTLKRALLALRNAKKLDNENIVSL